MITESAVRAAETRRTAAMVAGDVRELEVLLHTDLRYGHTSGAQDTKARYLEKFCTGELAYPEMSTGPWAFAQYGAVAALWVEGTGRAVTWAGEKVLHTSTLTLWAEGPAGTPQLLVHQPTVLL